MKTMGKWGNGENMVKWGGGKGGEVGMELTFTLTRTPMPTLTRTLTRTLTLTLMRMLKLMLVLELKLKLMLHFFRYLFLLSVHTQRWDDRFWAFRCAVSAVSRPLREGVGETASWGVGKTASWRVGKTAAAFFIFSCRRSRNIGGMTAWCEFRGRPLL